MANPAPTRIIRDASIRVKVQPETKQRLDVIAHLYGVPPATLASLWIGQSLAQNERNLNIASKIADTVGGEVGQAIRQQMSMMPELFGQGRQEAQPSQPAVGEP